MMAGQRTNRQIVEEGVIKKLREPFTGNSVQNKIYMSFLYAFIISCTSVNYHLGSYVVLESQSSFPLITTNSPQFRGKV